MHQFMIVMYRPVNMNYLFHLVHMDIVDGPIRNSLAVIGYS